MPASATPAQALGRPRDATLDTSILTAAMALLGEGGLAAVTMDAVAQRVGAGKASLYRRWKSKDELLADALTLHSPVDVAVDTGTLRGDLVKLYGQYYGAGNHVMQAALQEMLGNMRQHVAWTEKVAPERLTVRRAQVRALFDRALARGEIARPTDMDALLDIVPSMIFYRYNTRAVKVTRAAIAKLVDGIVMPLVQRASGKGARP